MQRMGAVIRIKPEKIAEYKQLHAQVWDDVLATISACNIKNYSIFLRQPENMLFSYFEYHGDDFEADMQKMADDPITQKWWSVCVPCQQPLESKSGQEWWAMMQQVFYHP